MFGPEFLTFCEEKPKPCDSALAVRSVSGHRQTADDCAHDSLEILIKTAPNLYTLKKRVAYLIAFKEYFVAKFKKRAEFKKPILNASYLDRALLEAVRYVQFLSFGDAIRLLREDSPDKFDQMLKKLYSKANGADQMRKINELKALRNLRPCVDTDMMLQVEERLENAEPPIDTKHPFILPSRHALTRLIILNEHSQAGHAGPAYTLMLSRQRFWIIFGIGSVKHYIAECGECALRKAKPIRQLMADLPSFRVTIANKPFQICGTDFLGPILYRQKCSECKAWGLLLTCISTCCLHVKIVTGLDLNNFLLAFSCFTNLRGKVDTIFSDSASTFCAAANVLPELLDSTEFANSVRQKGINWVKIPLYAPSQGGVWESMVKLSKNALLQVMGRARRKPTLIERQTFASDAVRIANDRPLTTPSDQPNDLEPITSSCFLGQHLAPNNPLRTFHDKGDLRNDYSYNATLAHKFWLSWVKEYLTNLQGCKKWRTCKENLYPGQLVLVGDSVDFAQRGTYRLRRIHAVHPQILIGKELVRRATVAVLAGASVGGPAKVEYILRDISKIAPA